MSDHTNFKIVLLYEDLVSGIRGSTVLKRVADQLAAESEDLESEVWKVELLDRPEFQQQALNGIKDASMIIIAAAGLTEFPSRIKASFETALSRHRGGAAAIVALLDWDGAPGGQMPPAGAWLRDLAARFGFDFFCNHADWPRPSVREAEPAIAEFEDDYGALRMGVPRETGARGWGIND